MGPTAGLCYDDTIETMGPTAGWRHGNTMGTMGHTADWFYGNMGPNSLWVFCGQYRRL